MNDNTYIRMVSTNVLAYIENSSKENPENPSGWYSFEDENGPISKQPESFTDLSIVVLSKLSEKTEICLVDKATNEETNTNITSSDDSLFDDKMFDVGAYRYNLPGSYFAENYTADVDTSLYLRVNNSGESLDLGEIYIDNTNPECSIPNHFKNWGWFSGSGKQTIVFDNVSEVLDLNETVAYVDGETIALSDLSGEGNSVFSYDEQGNQLSLTLEPGGHNVGLLLVDRAGNTKSITEVHHLAIGNYRVRICLGILFGAVVIVFFVTLLVKKWNRRKRSASA